MTALLYDLRDAWRGLRRDRLYAAAVIGTLALTLGATTAVYSIVDGVLLRPLSYPEPGALVSIREIVPAISQRYPTLPVTPRHFDVWRHRATSLASMAQMDWRTSTLTGAGDPAQVPVLRASGTLFDVLRIPTALGRGLTWDDERLDRPRVAVISDRLWRERFGADRGVLGRPVTLGGTDYSIVGVVAGGYTIPNLSTLNESGSLTSDFAAIVPFRISVSNFDWMGQFNYGVIARLRPGATLASARAEMDVLQGTVAEIARRETHEPAELRGWIMPLADTIAGPVRRGLLLLLGAVAGVLLIACANLANLTLTRAMARMRDAAVRGALGASRWRLIRGVLVEQAALAAAGGLVGIAVAAGALRLFVRTAPIALPRIGEVALDARAVGAAAAMALAASLVVGLLPAWRVGRGTVETILRSGGRSSDRGGRRVRSTLLAVQVALSVVLLAVSALFLSSLARLLRVDTGFAPEGATAIEIAPVSARYPDSDARAALYDKVARGVRLIPGVTALGWTSALPLTGETWVDRMERADRPDTKSSANFRFVGPEYFQAIGMPIVKGRSIADADRTHTVTPAVISARAARTLWPGEDAVGREFRRADPTHRFEVVGVVADGRVTALDSEPPLMVYLPYWYNNEGKSILVVRARSDAAAIAAGVRDAVRAVDADIAVPRIVPLQRVVDAAVETPRYQATLFAAFAAAALLIAVVGVYATTAYGISRQRREMNIRVALGARNVEVFGLVLRQSIAPLGAGLFAGLAGALALGGVVASLLYQVQPRDPRLLGVVLAVVALTGVAAAAVAARHTLQLDPAAALRDE